MFIHLPFLLLLLGCPSPKPDDTGADADGDGYDAGPDCDDADPAVHPEAAEVCNGRDDDCDIEVDESATDATNWFEDRDGDGYGDPDSPLLGCAASDGRVADGTDCNDNFDDINPGMEDIWYDGLDQDCDGASDYDADQDGFDTTDWGGDDCDDGASTIHPGVEEIWYDGIDQDCDGANDYDADKDAFVSDAWAGDDCDDGDAAVNPDATETWYDGIDQDCAADDDFDADADTFVSDAWGGDDCDDGAATTNLAAQELPDGVDNDCTGVADDTYVVDLGTAATRWHAEGDFMESGSVVAFAGDVDSDGIEDVLIGNRIDTSMGGASTVRLLRGGTWGDVPVSDDLATFWTTATDADFSVGMAMAAGDLDGDGHQDFAFGAPDYDPSEKEHAYGLVWVVQGPALGDVNLEDQAQAVLTGMVSQQNAGESVAIPGDLDGDGTDDLLVGIPGPATGQGGGAYVVNSDVTGTHTLADVGWFIEPEKGFNEVGTIVAGAGDVDADGWPDILVAAPSGGQGAAAWLLSGPVTSDRSLLLADARIANTDSSYEILVAGAGDVNGDGFDDIVVGDPGRWSAARTAGAAHLYHGPLSGQMDLWDADVNWIGDIEGDQVGTSVAGAGDVDGDGFEDILVGGAYYDGKGAAWLLRGITTGTASISNASRRFLGSTVDDYLGQAVAGGRDATADGVPDLLITAPSTHTSDPAYGSTYLFSGAELY